MQISRLMLGCCAALAMTSSNTPFHAGAFAVNEVREIRAKLEPTVRNIIFTSDLLRARPTGSLEECLHLCGTRCAALTFTASNLSSSAGRCRLHDAAVTSMSEFEPRNNTRTFSVTSSPWLGSFCTNVTSDPCFASNRTACYSGQCLCKAGYYYSLGYRTCVPDCLQERLSSHFLHYPGKRLLYYNLSCTRLPDESKCLALCLRTSGCKTVDRESDGACCLQDATALEVPEKNFYTDAQVQHYQRACLD